MSNYPVDLTDKPEVHGFFDSESNTISYIVKDPASTSCAIIDSVLDIDYAAGRITRGKDDANPKSSSGRQFDRNVWWS